MSHAALLRALALTACSLCLIVVVLGAYVRLSDAGLGCPDWPGCYGHLTPLGAAADVDAEHGSTHAIVQRSGRALELGKAWREMLHRYAAGSLAVLILCLAVLSVIWRRERIVSLPLSCALLGIVLVQALFGMLTVTWRLMPLIVTLHLLFGFTTLSLLWWLVLGLRRGPSGNVALPLRALALLALIALGLQIALGGWTSSNYAAIACPDVPTCQGSWWPQADFRSGYDLGRGIDLGPPSGSSSPLALVAIQLTHRLGALVATAALLSAALATLAAGVRGTAREPGGAAVAVLLLLAVQLTIGIRMVQRGFPLELATAHNAAAALLLLAILALNHSLRPSKA
jgi:heme a synthase